MGSLSPASILMLLASVAFQVLGLSMLPLTKGFTNALPTLVSAGGFVIGLGLLARLNHNGVDLGLIVPLTSTLIPLCAIAIGVLFYGEAASVTKIGLLIVACALIGLAAMVG